MKKRISATWIGILLGGIFLFSSNSYAQLTGYRVDKVPLRNPEHALWKQVKPFTVPLMPQNLVYPKIKKPVISNIKVKILYDNKYIAFYIEWKDATRNAVVDVDKYTDQVAIQLPMNPHAPPSFMMGNKGGKVHIIHWKAIWQDDITKGYRSVHHLYPNYWVDLYWFAETIFAEGEKPHPTYLRKFKNPKAFKFIPGMAAHNPVSELTRKEPAEEAMAEGFGTFTTQPVQNAKAWGVWKNNTWKVIIARPLVSPDPLDAPIPGKSFVAFAVWDGGSKNVGGRKHYTNWLNFQLLKKTVTVAPPKNNTTKKSK